MAIQYNEISRNYMVTFINKNYNPKIWLSFENILNASLTYQEIFNTRAQEII